MVHPPTASGLFSTQRAITDVYDEDRRTFLVQYPIWLVVGTGLAGVVAFALVGFLGYSDDVPVLRAVFSQAWPLFLWFCALIMALQISILRHPALRRQLVATLTVTILSMILVGIIYYYKAEAQRLLDQLLAQILNIRTVIPEIGKSKYLYAFINFLLIGLYWFDTFRRWVRRARGKPINKRVDISLDQSGVFYGPEDMPSMQELISGDLIAGAFLTLVLAFIFRADVITFFSGALQINVPIDSCTVAWPFGACTPPGGGLADPPTLTFIDLIQTLIYLPLGLLILALSAVLSGFGAVGGVDERQLGQGTTLPSADETSTESVSEQVSMTVLNTLRAALNRRIRLAAGNLALSLRTVAWPSLILLGTIAVAAAARDIRLYLHLMSDVLTCGKTTCIETVQQYGSPYQYGVLALLWGVVAVLGIVLSATLLIFSRRVAENTMRFLGLIGFIVLLTWWIFSLALSGFNLLLDQLNATTRWPFPQPGATTIISFAALVIWASIVLVRRMRSERAVPVGAGVGVSDGELR